MSLLLDLLPYAASFGSLSAATYWAVSRPKSTPKPRGEELLTESGSETSLPAPAGKEKEKEVPRPPKPWPLTPVGELPFNQLTEGEQESLLWFIEGVSGKIPKEKDPEAGRWASCEDMRSSLTLRGLSRHYSRHNLALAMDSEYFSLARIPPEVKSHLLPLEMVYFDTDECAEEYDPLMDVDDDELDFPKDEPEPNRVVKLAFTAQCNASEYNPYVNFQFRATSLSAYGFREGVGVRKATFSWNMHPLNTDFITYGNTETAEEVWSRADGPARRILLSSAYLIYFAVVIPYFRKEQSELEERDRKRAEVLGQVSNLG